MVNFSEIMANYSALQQPLTALCARSLARAYACTPARTHALRKLRGLRAAENRYQSGYFGIYC